MITFAIFCAGCSIGTVIGAWLHVATSPVQPVIRQPLPTCTALPSAWRADKERVVEALDRAWDR